MNSALTVVMTVVVVAVVKLTLVVSVKSTVETAVVVVAPETRDVVVPAGMLRQLQADDNCAAGYAASASRTAPRTGIRARSLPAVIDSVSDVVVT